MTIPRRFCDPEESEEDTSWNFVSPRYRSVPEYPCQSLQSYSEDCGAGCNPRRSRTTQFQVRKSPSTRRLSKRSVRRSSAILKRRETTDSEIPTGSASPFQSPARFSSESCRKDVEYCRMLPGSMKIPDRTWFDESTDEFRCCNRCHSVINLRDEKCCCFCASSAPKFRKTESTPRSEKPVKKNCLMKTERASTSAEESVDYHVPISFSKPCESESRSASRTLVPNSSHVTIRIQSEDSVESYSRKYTDGLEDTSPRSLKSCCGCGEISSKSGWKSRRNNKDGCGNRVRRSVDFDTSDEESFQRFRKILSDTEKSGRFPCPRNQRRKIRRQQKRPRTVCRNPCRGGTFMNDKSEIVLSAPDYRKFLENCKRIKRSIRNMMENETIESSALSGSPRRSSRVLSSRCEAPCGITLSDLRPDFPPIVHWSQYEDGMRNMTDEYRTLESCVNFVESEAEKAAPSCCTEKSVTRTYPSGTEFTFKVKRVPENKEQFLEEDLGSCEDVENEELHDPKIRPDCACENPGSMCPVKRGKGIKNVEESCAAMKTREADLVKTLENFCAKLKSMKSEFEKSPPVSVRPKSGRCPTCGRENNLQKESNRVKAKKLLIFPPEGEKGPPLTLYKNASSINCRVKGDKKTGFRYNVTYVQTFISSTWKPDQEYEGKCPPCVDSG